VTYGQFKVDLRPRFGGLLHRLARRSRVPRRQSVGLSASAELVRTISADEPAHWIHHLLAKMAVLGATPNDDVTLLLTHCTGHSHGAGLLGRLRALLKFTGRC